MTLEFEMHKCLCEPKLFKINGMSADYRDFGNKEDSLPASPYSYMCENMKFTPILPKQVVLDKYGINVDEYVEICDKLEKSLSFGRCGWCL